GAFSTRLFGYFPAAVSSLVEEDSLVSGVFGQLFGGGGSVCSVLLCREALAPFLKNEEARLRAESGAKGGPFQYVLCAATSPAVKQQEETLSYLNQGQSYEIRMLNRKLMEYSVISSKYVKSIVRIVFHDRRLQYMEHQQLEGWRWNRPGDRILDIDIPLSVGVIEPRSDPLHLNTIEFLWDPLKNASVFIQVNCISTEFTPRKHGGEKGVPFRIQVDTFTSNDHGEYVEHVHSSSCQVKVFKPKGADRKLKTDREKMEKKTVQDREKYQPSHDTTLLKEVRRAARRGVTPSSLQVLHDTRPQQENRLTHLLPSSSPQDTQQWLHRHRFSPFSRLFSSFSGNTEKSGRTWRTVGVTSQPGWKVKVETRESLYAYSVLQSFTISALCLSAVYHALYLEERTLVDLSEKIAGLYNITPQQITQIYRQKTTGIHILVSDEVSIKAAPNSDGYHVVLK
uniref:Transcription factor CP2-like 1 n=1 Tax=Cyprinodon variegatus TaxID=28743 RepID=A0A3Q2ECV7_CYPVA